MLFLSADLPPFLARPHYVPKPWGGRRLETDLGREDLPPGPVGESWEVSDLPELRSVIETGPAAGRPIDEILTEPFPLLVKVLDAREDLSVQVHPDGREDVAPAKEEAWVALADGGAVAIGEVTDAVLPEAGAWLDHLGRRPLEGPRGDQAPTLIHVPAGTVHAILAGSLVWEVQTPVDVTWRLDDHGRVGLDGGPRALHLDEARIVLGRGSEGPEGVSADGRALEGRRIALALHPPGRVSASGWLVAFLPLGGEVGWGPPPGGDPVTVPRGRCVVLTPQANGIASEGWILLAAPVGGV